MTTTSKPERGEVDGAAFFAEQRLAWTEKQFQAALLAAYCGTKKEPLPAGIGWKPFHTFFSKNSMAGWPDVVLVRDGRMVIAELKAERGRLSREQVECLELLREVQLGIAAAICGGRHELDGLPCHLHYAAAERLYGVYEWRPSDWSEIAEVLG